MITVLPCRDKTQIADLFKKNNIETTEFSSCVIAREKEKVLGYCLYNLTKSTMTVLTLQPQDDIPLADGILRSALHVAAENFVLDTFYDDNAPVELFRLLDFIKNEDEKRLNIDKLFGGCNCHK